MKIERLKKLLSIAQARLVQLTHMPRAATAAQRRMHRLYVKWTNDMIVELQGRLTKSVN